MKIKYLNLIWVGMIKILAYNLKKLQMQIGKKCWVKQNVKYKNKRKRRKIKKKRKKSN